ncbi:MAG: hypothetical protein H6Q68_3727 [Firmicutes bacterium]|nr:hypothetical protein [Bacillota bacterium]
MFKSAIVENEFANQIDKLCQLLKIEENPEKKEQLFMDLEKALNEFQCYRLLQKIGLHSQQL